MVETSTYSLNSFGVNKYLVKLIFESDPNLKYFRREGNAANLGCAEVKDLVGERLNRAGVKSTAKQFACVK